MQVDSLRLAYKLSITHIDRCIRRPIVERTIVLNNWTSKCSARLRTDCGTVLTSKSAWKTLVPTEVMRMSGAARHHRFSFHRLSHLSSALQMKKLPFLALRPSAYKIGSIAIRAIIESDSCAIISANIRQIVSRNAKLVQRCWSAVFDVHCSIAKAWPTFLYCTQGKNLAT